MPDPILDSLSPPIARRVEPVHLPDSTRPGDEYSWLHEPDNCEVRAQLQAERDYHDLVIAPIRNMSETLRTEMVSRTPRIDRSVSYSLGSYSYYTLFAEGTEYGTFVRESLSGTGPIQTLLDLDEVARECGADYLATGVTLVSPNGHLMAWSVDLLGDEIYQMFIRDLTTGSDLADRLPHTYYGAAWSIDSKHLFYTVHDDIYRPFQVWRHEIGTPSSADSLILEDLDQRYDVSVAASRSGEFIFITAECRDTQEVWIVSAKDPRRGPISVGGRRKGHVYSVMHTGGDGLLALTNSLGATEFRLVRGSVSEVIASGPADISRWLEVIPHDPGVRLVTAEPFADNTVILSRADGGSQLQVLDSQGALQYAILPTRSAGSVEFGSNFEWQTTSFTMVEHSYIDPSVWWDVDISTGRKSLRHRDETPNYVPEQYRTDRRWVSARDGKEIPITLLWHKNTALDGTAPCVLFGYGAYEFSYEPEFDASLISLLDRGLVYVHAHVRGGGELGRQWWDSGHLHSKLNSFYDFIDVADFLANGVVAPDKIVSRGGSAGGLLVMASLCLAPLRWRAVIAEVPFVDVINSMSDPEIPLTINEWDEWGDPRSPADLAYLLRYSPYENIPADLSAMVLLTGAAHDPRVLIREPAKWTARARHLLKDAGAVTGFASRGQVANGIIFRPELGAGSHSGAAGRYAHLDDEALTQAVILRATGVA